MNIVTKPWHVIVYALALCYCVTVASCHYSEVEHERIDRDLIISKREQQTDIEIAKIAQVTIISEDAVKIAEHYEAIASYQEQATGHKAIAKVWGCR